MTRSVRVGCSFGLIMCLAACGNDDAATESTAVPRSNAVAGERDSVKAVYLISPGGGMSDADFNTDYAASLEEFATNSIREKMLRNYRAAGGSNEAALEVVSRAALMNVDGVALISVVTRAFRNDVSPKRQIGMFVKVVRLRAGTLHQVTCVSDGAEDFNIWSGACGDKIRETLSVNVDHT